MTKTHVSAAVLAAASSVAIASQAVAAPPPIEAFGRLPGVQDVEIAPDGQRVLMLGGPPTQRQVTISTIDDNKQAILNLGDVKTRFVRWAGDDYALVRTTVMSPDITKEVVQFNRDVVIDQNAKPITRLLQNDDFLVTGYPILGIVPAEKPFAMMMGVARSSQSMTNAKDTRMTSGSSDYNSVLLKVDIKSGKGSIDERGTAHTSFWSVDLEGEARVRYDSNSAGNVYTLLARPKGAKNWRNIWQSKDPNAIDAYEGYSDGEDSIYLSSMQADGSMALDRRSLVDGAVTRVPLPKPWRSISLGMDPYLKRPLMVTAGAETAHPHWLDPEIGAIHAKLLRALKTSQVTLMSWSKDRTRFIVLAESADTPPAWYLFDNAKKELSPIGDSYPELKGAALGKTTYYAYKARDGLQITAYLTVPTNLAPGAKAPLIVLPHGGPASRDDDSFDWWTQFLASRGYAVLRPQFRGSTGFGEAFERAGDREWAGKMQTDLIDGVNDAAAKGLIDPKRVCIVGASYGGYAALAAATFYPASYRCAVSVAGVSDLPAMIGEYRRSYDSANSGLTYWRQVLGRETGAGSELLATSSPARQAAKTGVPVLLIHGKIDSVVPYEQSEYMQKALVAAGKPVEFVTLEGDDHHLSTSPTRTAMLRALETFLARHNPAS